jgi:hypothetical protein
VTQASEIVFKILQRFLFCLKPPLWSSGWSGYRSWGPGFDSLRYQIFWEVVGLERGPLSLVRIIEELFEWKSSGSGSRNPKLRPWGSVAPLVLTSPAGCGRSVGIVRLRTKKNTECSVLCGWYQFLLGTRQALLHFLYPTCTEHTAFPSCLGTLATAEYFACRSVIMVFLLGWDAPCSYTQVTKMVYSFCTSVTYYTVTI